MSHLEKRWLIAQDFLSNPSMLDSYPHKYVLLLDRSLDFSHQNLLEAIEQMEGKGWTMHNISLLGSSAMMCALMSHQR